MRMSLKRVSILILFLTFTCICADVIGVEVNALNTNKTSDCNPPLEMDINDDCIVNVADLNIFASQWLTNYLLSDFAVLANEWLDEAHHFYYVSNSGNDSNDGSINAPFKTIANALLIVEPGDTVYIRAGVYRLDQITQRSGTQEAPITIKAYNHEKVILEGAGQTDAGGRFRLRNDWYIIEGLDFAHGSAGLTIKYASHNKIINCAFHGHYYTGLYIGNASSNNEIINCDAYDMYDSGSGGSNADGFGVNGQVSTPGPNNSFTSCRAWNNSDDGFDMWKATYPVHLTNCLSYKNGTHNGDGNGFKLGINKTQSDIHVLRNCLAWGNRRNGFDYNDSTLPQVLYNCCGYNNYRNFKFSNYGGGPEIHDLQSCISAVTTVNDILLTSIINNKTNSWNLIAPNAEGIEDNFLSTDDTIITGDRNIDGTIPESDFLKLKSDSILFDCCVPIE